MREKLFLKSVLFLVLFVLVSAVPAQDWTRWRGANGDGATAGFVAPKSWPAQLQQKWKITVGAGHASPLVAGNRVYQHARQGENEVAGAYDLETGKAVWTERYAVAYTMNPAATGHGKGPKSTPVLGGGNLYTLGITGVLSCHDAATGKLKWRKEGASLVGAKAPLFGTAASPILDRGLLIASLGGHDQGGMIAFDAETGAEKWRWTGDGPGYATPVVIEIAGKRQIITQSQQNIIGVWADNGTLLWKIPFTTEYVQNIVTPLVYRDMLVFSGINKGVFAVRPGWRDNQWVTETVWQNKEVSMYMNSPVLASNLLFGLSHRNKGQFFCLDVATGKTRWTGDPRQGENAAMVLAGDTIFSLTNDAKLLVTRASDQAATPIKSYTVAGSPTWAHPVIAGKRIVIKDEQSLALFALE
jgi:outer membrane protein assembly factor BamB